jgi:hypothetical protein
MSNKMKNSNNKKTYKKKKKSSPKKSNKRDKRFYDEMNKASEIFFNECIVSEDTADEIRTRAKYELSFNGYNIWFNIGSNKDKDKIIVNKESNYEFLRSKFFKNYNFQKRVYDYYLKNLPEVETKFIGPIKGSGDILIKLVPYYE